MVADDWVVSADGGGSSTDVLLANIPLKTALLKRGGGTNPNVYGDDGIERLRKLMQKVLSETDVAAINVKTCVVGMAGISHPKYRPTLKQTCEALFPQASLQLISDAELAHRTIWGEGPGMTLIVGTGSIAVGEDKDGKLRRAGGFGFQSGDVGGGYWFGKSLLTELIAADRSNDDEIVELRQLVTDHFGVSSFEEALEKASGGEGVSIVAGLTPEIFQLAENGNFIASQIVASGADGLRELVDELIEKIDFSGDLGLHGSVITESHFYRTMLMNRLEFDGWRKADFPAVFGGLVAAGAAAEPEELVKFTVTNG